MLTKAQWDAMTPQAQWDYVQSLMADVEAREAEADAELERKQWNSGGIQPTGQRRVLDEEAERGVIQRLRETGYPLIADFREQRLLERK